MKDWIVEEASLIKAGFIYSSLMILLALNPGSENIGSEVGSSLIIEALTAACLPFYFVLCIRYIKGSTKTSNKPPYHQTPLTVWDYVWRAFVAMWVTTIPLTFILTIWPDVIRNTHWLIVTMITLIEVPIVILVLFCSDRIAFLKKMFLFFKGIRL